MPDINKSIKSLLAELKNDVTINRKSLNDNDVENIINRISRLEDVYEQLLSKSESESDLAQLIDSQANLEESKLNLISQIENTNDEIWSVDINLRIKTVNSSFAKDYKTAFGVKLSEGVSVLESLPEPLKTVWKGRYKRSLKGEKFSVIDNSDIKDIPQAVEVSFNPIRVGEKVIGVSCRSHDITNQKSVEAALKLSEQRFKTMVGNMPSVTYRCATDECSTMNFISNEIESLSGYPAKDFLNNNVRSFASIIYSEDKELVHKAVQLGIKNKTSYKIEYRVLNKNNTLKWVHERGRAFYNDKGDAIWIDGFITDITARRQSDIVLRESEELYRAIFNSMSDLFIRTDMQGNILIVSPSVIDFLGFTPNDIVGRPISELYNNPLDRKRLMLILSKKGFVREFEAVLTTKDGNKKVASVNAKLLINSLGEPYGVEGITRDITLHKIAQKTLEERTKELDSIFENTPVILLLVDAEGRVLNINKAGSQHSHQGKSHLTNRLAGEAIKCVNAIRTKTPCGKGEHCNICTIRNTIEKTFNTKQNQHQIEGNLVFVEDGVEVEKRFLISTAFIDFEQDKRVLVSLDDITEMRAAEEKITRLSAAVEQSTATIVITDLNGNIEYVNPQFEKSTGYKVSEVIGENPRVLKSENSSADVYVELWKTILDGKTWKGEFLNVRKNKTQYWESAIISPIRNREGVITHFLAIKEDITERKRIREELVHSEQELREMNDEKSRYLSILAHDLRGLVGSYHAYTDLILTHFEDFSEDDLKEQLGNLTKVSGESLNLLDNILAWGKTSQGQIKLLMESVDINAEAESVINLLSEIAKNKKINLINNIPAQTIITSDVNVFQTIMRNLINNAIKFTSLGGSISIEAEKKAELIEISVTDTGIGMDDKTIKKLFKLGEKVVKEGTDHEQGTGLGLIICKEMVKKLGGTIKVESELNKGSRFYFSIPTLSDQS